MVFLAKGQTCAQTPVSKCFPGIGEAERGRGRAAALGGAERHRVARGTVRRCGVRLLYAFACVTGTRPKIDSN